METRDGGHYFATVEYKNGGKIFYKKDYKQWDYYYVRSVKVFEDPRIGKFSYV
jgi:hypothetical protein